MLTKTLWGKKHVCPDDILETQIRLGCGYLRNRKVTCSGGNPEDGNGIQVTWKRGTEGLKKSPQWCSSPSCIVISSL